MNLRRPDSWNFSYLAVFDKTQWSLWLKIIQLILTKMLDLVWYVWNVYQKKKNSIQIVELLGNWKWVYNFFGLFFFYKTCCIRFWIILNEICQCGFVLLWSNRSLSSTFVALYNSRGPSLIFFDGHLLL